LASGNHISLYAPKAVTNDRDRGPAAQKLVFHQLSESLHQFGGPARVKIEGRGDRLIANPVKPTV
jgi:hypothetical protein